VKRVRRQDRIDAAALAGEVRDSLADIAQQQDANNALTANAAAAVTQAAQAGLDQLSAAAATGIFAGIASQHVSTTTANPAAVPADGSAGMRLGSGGGWQRLIVQGGAWVPVGPEIVGRSALAPRLPAATQYMTVPTPDGNPDIRHPDVLYIPGGWNGYAYWMVYTPYPGPSRENPVVVASHDGASWELPSGAPKLELMSNAEIRAAGYLYGSDTDMVLTPDNKIRIYFRLVQEVAGDTSQNKEAIYTMITSDGRNWSAPAPVIEIATPGRTAILSPAVSLEADNTYSMWSVNHNGPTTLDRRTSPDGLTWSAPVTCTVTGVTVDHWHPHVTRIGGRYYMLMQTTSQVLYWFESYDGLNWTAPVSVPAVPANFDAASGYNNQYRSCVIPREGGRWDLILSVYNSDSGASRFISLRNIDMPLPSSRYVPTPVAGLMPWPSVQIGIGATLGAVTGNYAVAIGNKASVTGNNAVAMGTDAKALSADSVAIGNTAVANLGFSVALGALTTVNGTGGIAIGRQATSAGGIAIGNAAVTGGNSVAIGASVNASTGSGNTAIGQGLVIPATTADAVVIGNTASVVSGSVSIGKSALGTGTSSTAVGTSADSSGAYSAALGKNARAQGAQSAAFGVDALASSTYATALGQASQAVSGSATAVGALATATAGSATAVGKSATAAQSATAIGTSANAGFTRSTAIGMDAATTASNQIMLGTSAETVVVPGKTQLAGQVGFYGATPAAKLAITGSRGGNAALADLLTKLATLGLITDNTTA
jgi:hypothetical protein